MQLRRGVLRRMADKAIEPGKKSTERYLPEAAWKAMSKAERNVYRYMNMVFVNVLS